MSVACFNHEFVDLDKVHIPFYQRGPALGEGIFTTIKLLDGKLYFLKKHLHRLRLQAKYLCFSFPEITQDIFSQLIESNRAHAGLWRMKIILFSKEEGLQNFELKKTNWVIFLQKQKLLKKPKRLCVYPTPVLSPLARIKTLSYMDRLFLKSFALEKGSDECISVDENNHLLQGCFSNLFWIKKDTFFFSSPQLLYFRGITLRAAILAAKKIGLKIKSGKFLVENLNLAQVFVCNSMMEICPVERLNEKQILRNVFLEEKLFTAYSDIAKRYLINCNLRSKKSLS